jgi:hypothetical protein
MQIVSGMSVPRTIYSMLSSDRSSRYPKTASGAGFFPCVFSVRSQGLGKRFYKVGRGWKATFGGVRLMYSQISVASIVVMMRNRQMTVQSSLLYFFHHKDLDLGKTTNLNSHPLERVINIRASEKCNRCFWYLQFKEHGRCEIYLSLPTLPQSRGQQSRNWSRSCQRNAQIWLSWICLEWFQNPISKLL